MTIQSAPAFCVASIDFKSLILASWKLCCDRVRQSFLRNPDR